VHLKDPCHIEADFAAAKASHLEFVRQVALREGEINEASKVNKTRGINRIDEKAALWRPVAPSLQVNEGIVSEKVGR